MKFFITEEEKSEILKMYFKNSNKKLINENEQNSLSATLSQDRVITFINFDQYFEIRIILNHNNNKKIFQVIDNKEGKNYIKSNVLPEEIETEKNNEIEFVALHRDLDKDTVHGTLNWNNPFYKEIFKNEVIVGSEIQTKFKSPPNLDFTENSIWLSKNNPNTNIRWEYKKENGKYYYKRNMTKSPWIETGGDVELAIAFIYFEEPPEKYVLKWQESLNLAVTYWKNWLNNEETIRKLKENWKNYPKEMNKYGCISNSREVYKGDNIKNLVLSKYYELLNNFNIIIYSKYTPQYNSKNDIAYVIRENCKTKQKTIYCNYVYTYKKNLEQTLIHEIQHALYNIAPMNPDSKVNQIFKNKNNFLDNIFKNKSEIQKTVDEYEEDNIGFWYYAAKEEAKKKDTGYICRETEKLSNIQSIRKLFGVGPGQKLTKQMFEPYIRRDKDDINVYWYLVCWAHRQFPDLNKMMEKINELAFEYENSKENNINNLEKDSES